ncbi:MULTISPECIES: glycosyltransferase family 9 protein [Microbacterium]|uniref:glycosyltransferase family 9 protein n=1 Tax=Microbacterium TaxID=33882 RepID=UPI0024AEBBC5|nr:glycosyltransferase family 9 protein [Microbacterium barkeri]MDI6942259.1 glycosyltransferase family 9 protein [Microbacterium barkeri]
MRRRVLVARLDSMGDVLLAGPAVRAVAREAEVIMLCGPRGAAAGALLPGVRDVMVWDAPWISDPAPAVTGGRIDQLIHRLRTARIDEAVILTSFHQSPLPLALLLRLAGVDRIAGASVDYPGSLLDVRLRPGEDLPEDIPEVDRACAIAEAAGFPAEADRRLRVRDVADASALVGDGRYIVLHPGAAVGARRWPAEGFAGAARLLAESGRRVVVTGAEGERDLTALVARAAGPHAVDLAGACDLRLLAGVLAGADAVVVGNTGPAHLAAAVGTPVVSLFSPVVPAVRWAPYGVPVALLGDQDAPCRGTRARDCPVPGHPCLAGVAPAEVAAAAIRLADAREAHPIEANPIDTKDGAIR